MKRLLLILVLLPSLKVATAQRHQVEKSIEKNYQDKYGAAGMEKLKGWMNNVMNAETEEQYVFPISMNMHITEYDNGKTKESDIRYFLNNKMQYFGFNGADYGDRKKRKGQDMFLVYDFNNNAMITINEEEKTTMAININAFMSKEAQDKMHGNAPTNEESDVQCKKSGKTKNIQGYSCEEYVCIDQDRNRRSEIWITKDIPINIANTGSKGPWAMYFRNASGLTGMMMEGNFYKNEHQEAKMEVTELNEQENKTIIMANYESAMPNMR